MKKLVARVPVEAVDLLPQLNVTDRNALPTKVVKSLLDNCHYFKNGFNRSYNWIATSKGDSVSTMLESKFKTFEFYLDIELGYDSKKMKYNYLFSFNLDCSGDDETSFLKELALAKPKYLVLEDGEDALSAESSGELGNEDLVVKAATGFAKAIEADFKSMYSPAYLKQVGSFLNEFMNLLK